MKSSVKAVLVTVALAVVLLVVALVFVLINQNRAAAPETGTADGPQVVRENSHVLDDGGEGAVTVVEFLDFELSLIHI